MEMNGDLAAVKRFNGEGRCNQCRHAKAAIEKEVVYVVLRGGIRGWFCREHLFGQLALMEQSLEEEQEDILIPSNGG